MRITIFVLLLLVAENTYAQYAIQFNNDSAYIYFGEQSAFDVETITIEAWIKLSEYRPGVIIAKPGAYYLKINDSLQLDAGIYDESDEDWFISTGKTYLDINEFYHVAFTYNGSNINVYLNGKLDEANHLYSSCCNNAGQPAAGRMPVRPGNGAESLWHRSHYPRPGGLRRDDFA